MIEFLQKLPPETVVHALEEKRGSWESYTEWTDVLIPLDDSDGPEATQILDEAPGYSEEALNSVYGNAIEYFPPTESSPTPSISFGES